MTDASSGVGKRRPVVWVSHFLPYPSTGHGALQRTHHLVRQLATRFDVRLIALSNGAGTAADILDMGVSRCALFPVAGRARQLSAALRGTLPGPGYWEHLFDSAPMRRAVHTELQDAGGGALLLLDTIFLAPYQQGARVPVVLNHHNVESDLLRQRARMASGARRVFFDQQASRTAALERRLAPLAASNLVVSAEDGARLRAIAPDARCTVVANGVDVEFFRSSGTTPRRPHSLVWAGGMDWFPNRDAVAWLARDLWPRLVADEPRRTLTVIGKAPPPEILELAATDARVRVLGFVPDVRPYIEEASAYLCPIRVGGGTRLKVLDALAMGCPLVATSLSVDGLGVEDGVHYCRGDDAGGIVERLRALDTDAELRARVVSAGRRLVEERFSWRVVGEALADSLERIP